LSDDQPGTEMSNLRPERVFSIPLVIFKFIHFEPVREPKIDTEHFRARFEKVVFVAASRDLSVMDALDKGGLNNLVNQLFPVDDIGDLQDVGRESMRR